MVSENNYSFPHLIVDQEATLGVGAEDGTAEAAQEAGAAPTGATGVPGELADPAPCVLCSPGPARAKWALRLLPCPTLFFLWIYTYNFNFHYCVVFHHVYIPLLIHMVYIVIRL